MTADTITKSGLWDRCAIDDMLEQEQDLYAKALAETEKNDTSAAQKLRSAFEHRVWNWEVSKKMKKNHPLNPYQMLVDTHGEAVKFLNKLIMDFQTWVATSLEEFGKFVTLILKDELEKVALESVEIFQAVLGENEDVISWSNADDRFKKDHEKLASIKEQLVSQAAEHARDSSPFQKARATSPTPFSLRLPQSKSRRRRRSERDLKKGISGLSMRAFVTVAQNKCAHGRRHSCPPQSKVDVALLKAPTPTRTRASSAGVSVRHSTSFTESDSEL